MDLRHAGTLVLALIVAGGCDARFEDLRPGEGPGDGGPAADAAPPVDAGDPPADGGPPDARGSDAATADAATTDAGARDAGADRTFEGTFEGRSGYDTTGTVTVVDPGGQRFRIELSEGFSTAAVPGPVVVVTARDTLSGGLQDGDYLVARLGSDQLTGPLTLRPNETDVRLPELPSPLRVFVYCEPFEVETGRAFLTEVTP